eukprot:3286186-Pleurochrysis_carterae.AAC.1
MPPPGQLAADFAKMQAFQAAVASMEPDAQFYFLEQIRNVSRARPLPSRFPRPHFRTFYTWFLSFVVVVIVVAHAAWLLPWAQRPYNCPALEMSFEVPTGYWQYATFVVGKKPLTTDDERA